MSARIEILKEHALNCYREMFAASTPSADFDELMANATVNERGQKEIPFMDHVLEQDTFDKILNNFLESKTVKLTKAEKKDFSVTIHLGCSPRTKRDI